MKSTLRVEVMNNERKRSAATMAQRQIRNGGGLIRNRIQELRLVMASELIPNPKNWRRHSQFQQNVLRGLFAEIGYADALLVRELPEGRLQLIDGHLRAATTPDQLVPVLILDVTEQEAEKILLTLDPLAGLAEADPDRVRDLLATVTTGDDDLQELLMMIAEQASGELPDPGTLIDPEPQIDKANELQRKWRTASGQVWQIASHILACGDCRDGVLVARLFGKCKARMIWTDAPYGVSMPTKINS